MYSGRYQEINKLNGQVEVSDTIQSVFSLLFKLVESETEEGVECSTMNLELMLLN